GGPGIFHRHYTESVLSARPSSGSEERLVRNAAVYPDAGRTAARSRGGVSAGLALLRGVRDFVERGAGLLRGRGGQLSHVSVRSEPRRNGVDTRRLVRAGPERRNSPPDPGPR